MIPCSDDGFVDQDGRSSQAFTHGEMNYWDQLAVNGMCHPAFNVVSVELPQLSSGIQYSSLITSLLFKQGTLIRASATTID